MQFPRSSKGGLMTFHESRLYTLGETKVLSSGTRRFYFRCKNPLCHGKMQCDDTGTEGVYANPRVTAGSLI